MTGAMNNPPSAIPYRFATDANLVIRARAGEPMAFDELVRRYRAGVLLICGQMLRCTALAEDAAQEAMVQAHRGLPLLKNPERFGPWLHAIARNVGLRAGRGERRIEPTEPEEIARRIGAQSETPGLAEKVVDEEDRASVRRFVIELPSDLGEPLILHYWEQWPLERIASFLAVPVSTVKWRMYQGRKRVEPRLVELLEENEHE
jgi:RNA polymerase sigma-70 factor (ECF subfamily)